MARKLVGNALHKSRARKSSKKKSSKKKSATPVLAQLRYQFLGGVANASDQRFIDIAAGLSLQNRRLYEQGKMYHIKSVRFVPTLGVPSTGTSALCQVATASPGWVTTAAWKKAKGIHTQMNSGRGGAPGSGLPSGVTKATWGDFKVYLSNDHYDDRATFNVPEDSFGGDANITNSEWVYSEFTSPVEGGGDDQFVTHLVGDDAGGAGARASAGIILGYQESRRTVEQDQTDGPIDTANAWMIQIFDDGDTLDEIAQNLLDEGDLPPYDIDDYPGADDNLDQPMTRGMSTVVAPTPANYYLPTATLGGFAAPCGLLMTSFSCDQASVVYHVIVDVVLGDYKGVKALPM